MKRLFIFLLPLCLAFSSLQEPEVRWIKADTRQVLGTVISSNEKLVEINVPMDTSISVQPVKAVLFYGPTAAEELRVMGFEITYIRPDKDTLTQQVRGPFFPANMMAILKTVNQGDQFHVKKLRIEGPSATPVLLKREFLFRITY